MKDFFNSFVYFVRKKADKIKVKIGSKIGLNPEAIFLSNYREEELSKKTDQLASKKARLKPSYYFILMVFILCLAELSVDSLGIPMLSRVEPTAIIEFFGVNLTSIINYEFQANLGIIGILIPLVLLVYNSIGELTGYTFVSVFKETIGLNQTIFFGLSTIFLQLAIVVLTSTIIDINALLWQLRLFIYSSILTIFNFYFVSRLIYFVLNKSLDMDWLFKTLRNLLNHSMRIYHLFKFEKWFKKLKFKTQCEDIGLAYKQRSLEGSESALAIESSKLGTIKDINLKELVRFGNNLSGNIENDHKAIIYKGPFRSTSEDSLVLAEVSEDNENKLDSLKDILLSAFQIDNTEPEDFKYNELSKETRLLKDLTIKSLEERSETQFEELLEIYSELLTSYRKFSELTYPVHLSNLESSLFTDIGSLSLLKKHLRNIGRKAISLGEPEFIESLTFSFCEKLEEAVYKDSFKIFDFILDLYRSFFYYALKQENRVAIHRIRHYMNNVEDSYFPSALSHQNPDNIFNMKKYWERVILARMQILKETLEENNLEVFESIKRDIEGIPADIAQEEVTEVIRSLEGKMEVLDEESPRYEELQGKLKAHKELKTPNQWLTPIKNRIWFEVGNFASRKLKRGKNTSYFEEVIDSILDYFSKPRKLLKTFENTIKGETPDLKWKPIWEEHKESREVQVAKPHTRHYLFFCLVGLKLTSEKSEWPDLESEVILEMGNFKIIKSTAHNLLKGRDKWSDLIPNLDEHLVARFINHIYDVRQNTEEAEERKIIESPLSEDRIEGFRDNVMSIYWKANPLQSILNKLNVEIKELPYKGSVSREIAKNINILGGKKNFIDQEKLIRSYEYYPAFKYVRHLISKERETLFEYILNRVETKKNFSKNISYELLSDAIEELQESGFETEIIFASSNMLDSDFFIEGEQAEFSAYASKGLKNKWEEAEGFLQSIPVIRENSMPKNNFLIANFSDTTRLIKPEGIKYERENVLEINIEEYSKDEIRRLAEEEDLTKKDLRKMINLKIQSNFRIEIINREGFILLQKTNDNKK